MSDTSSTLELPPARTAPAPKGDRRPPGRLPRTDPAKVEVAIRANWRATILLAAALLMIGAVVGYVAGWAVEVFVTNEFSNARSPGRGLFLFSHWGLAGMLTTLAIGVVLCGRALLFGASAVTHWVGAREVYEGEMPELHRAAERVARAAGVIKPRLVVIDSPALNAFAAGRDPLHGTIGVTRGLVQTLTADELEAVLAHEMSHLVNRDVLYAGLVAIAVGMAVFARDAAFGALRSKDRSSRRRSSGGRKRGGVGGPALVALIVLALVLLLAPVMAQLVRIAMSREREYAADAGGAAIIGSPEPLMRALEKIESHADRLTVSKAVQHIFIVNPLRHVKEGEGFLLATHPATSDRIRRLRTLAA
jgi:heat shock protein HtpX